AVCQQRIYETRDLLGPACANVLRFVKPDVGRELVRFLLRQGRSGGEQNEHRGNLVHRGSPSLSCTTMIETSGSSVAIRISTGECDASDRVGAVSPSNCWNIAIASSSVSGGGSV